MANISAEVVEDRIQRFGRLYMIDDLVRERAKDAEQCPILGYPKYKDSASEYEYFTGKDLDRMVNGACWALIHDGFEVNSRKTVGLYAQSDLSFIVTFFALFRLGYKVLAMSIRLGPPACLALLDRAECSTVLCGDTPRIQSVTASIGKVRPDIVFQPMLQRDRFDQPDDLPQPPFERVIADREAEHTQVALIAHSSGSTGLPKPLFLSHRGLLHTRLSGTGLKAFNALPWYHLHGLITSIQAMWMRKTAHLFNTNLPLTADNLVLALEEIQPEICHTVPYTLKLMAEVPAGVEVLKRCKIVTSAGARTPDELGDRLIKDGVRLAVIFGLTEVGHMGDSTACQPDAPSTWAYIRPFANLKSHMFFKKIDDRTYESVYLKSHPALMMSNSNDPPGSFHSRDLFAPHPTIPNAWKYIARDDDRITLLNGEKILPLTMEGTVRENPLVRDALMVGLDKPLPGMMVFRSEAAGHLSDDEFKRVIWPSVEEANRIADEFAQIVPEMILPMPSDIEYPCTDKNNIIRAQAYTKFAHDIEALYTRLEKGHGSLMNGAGKRITDFQELESFLKKLIEDHAGVGLKDTAADFFSVGIDSLRAIQIRRLLQETLDLRGSSLPTNVVYDTGNVSSLTHFLLAIQNGDHLPNGYDATGTSLMESLVTKFSDFSTFQSVPQSVPDSDVVILTGATGALGAHILNALLVDPSVEHVYCLVRGTHPFDRVRESLKLRGITISPGQDLLTKVTALGTSTLDAPDLGLSKEHYAHLQSQTTIVIHAAWPVNFSVSLGGFEPQVAGLSNLLKLALAVPFCKPARFLFTSSISTAFQMPIDGTSSIESVPEAPLPSLTWAAKTGYARSKLIGERLCEAAARAGGRVAVLRIGQIVGDTQKGIWNDKEAIPIMIQSVRETGMLPILKGRSDVCHCMPVDMVAKACLEIAESLAQARGANSSTSEIEDHFIGGDHSPAASYYNIVPEHSISWNDFVLPALKKGGLDFKAVQFSTWLSAVHHIADRLGAGAGERLPAIKLIKYYEDDYGDGSVSSEIRFDTMRSHLESPTMKSSCNVDSHLIEKFLRSWLEKWHT